MKGSKAFLKGYKIYFNEDEINRPLILVQRLQLRQSPINNRYLNISFPKKLRH